MNVFVHALNGMPDHIHLVCSIPPTMAVADFAEKIKGSSSHFINHLPGHPFELYWQRGYGALTFSKRDLSQIVAYVDKQKTHHADGRLSPKMERLDDD